LKVCLRQKFLKQCELFSGKQTCAHVRLENPNFTAAISTFYTYMKRTGYLLPFWAPPLLSRWTHSRVRLQPVSSARVHTAVTPRSQRGSGHRGGSATTTLCFRPPEWQWWNFNLTHSFKDLHSLPDTTNMTSIKCYHLLDRLAWIAQSETSLTTILDSMYLAHGRS
jgi:hypothetical protein